MFKKSILVLGLFWATAVVAQPQLVGPLDARNNLSEIAGNGSAAQSAARNNLGLGSIATQGANAAAITGGTIAGADLSNANITTATGSTARTPALRAADVVNVRDGYGGQPGAKGDGQFATPAITTTVNSGILTTGSATFAATDVGKWVVVANAASPTTNNWGANVGPVTSIPVTSPGSGYTSVPTCAETDSSGSGNNATCQAWMALQSATVTNSGTCINGTWTFFATQPTNRSPAQFTGTVVAGVITSLVLTSPGQYASLTGIGLTSGQCSTQPTATFSAGVGFIQTLDWGNNAAQTPDNSYSQATTTASLTGGSPTTPATLGTPVVTVVIPPWIGQITTYTSPTQVTLSTTAGVNLTNVSTQIFWGTDDSTAIQNAYTAAASNTKNSVYFPAGVYWVKTGVHPGYGTTSTRGDGMNATILMWDSGSQTTYAGTGWNPLFWNINAGSPSAPNGNFQIEDLQIRGTLDFGRKNQGAPAFAMNFYNSWTATRVKFYQIPFIATQNEGMKHYWVDNSMFDTVERDQARCRTCFDFKVTNSTFLHSDDDSVAAHQGNQLGAYTLYGGGALRDSVLVEGNYFEDSTCVHILGGRNVIVRGNTFKRCKVNAVTISTDPIEGAVAMFNIVVADNIATDTISRPPYITGNPAVFSVSPTLPAASINDATIVPGEPIFGTIFFPPPWNSYLGSTITPVTGTPAATGIIIHDNVTLRTMPSTTAYSSWGFGPGFSYVGFVDAPVIDAALIPNAGINVTAFSNSMQIHHNNINNNIHGIEISGTQVYTALGMTQIDQNNIFDASGGGLYDISSGYREVNKVTNNIITVDPYHISPGRFLYNGSWSNGYNNAYCILINESGTSIIEDNVLRDCYAAAPSNNFAWARDNYVFGAPYPSTTGFLTTNIQGGTQGIGAYPYLGEGFRLIPITSAGSVTAGQGPAGFNQNSSTHPYESLAMPSTNLNYKVGEFVRSLDPVSCSCFGWMRMNSTSTSNVAGTDWKLVPLQ